MENMKAFKSETDWFENAVTVNQVMTPNPYTVHPNAALDEVLTEMIDLKISSAIVVNSGGKVIGIFTIRDALEMLRALVLLGSSESERRELEYAFAPDRKAA